MRIPKKRYLVLFFILLLLLVRFVAEIGPDRTAGDRFRAVKIIDGDTMELQGGDLLRLLAIDTPEKGEPFYDSATAYLSSLALGKSGEIQYGQRKRDGYGRLLGHFITDSLWVNREMLRQGLATIYLFEDNLSDRQAIDRLLAAQEEAMRAGRGVWSLERRPEEFYLAIKGSLRFHRPHCRSLRKSDPKELLRFGAREEAFREGYSPCRNCRP